MRADVQYSTHILGNMLAGRGGDALLCLHAVAGAAGAGEYSKPCTALCTQLRSTAHTYLAPCLPAVAMMHYFACALWLVLRVQVSAAQHDARRCAEQHTYTWHHACWLWQ
jgi:hypothetical protein